MSFENFHKGIDISIILEQFFASCVDRFYVTLYFYQKDRISKNVADPKHF